MQPHEDWQLWDEYPQHRSIFNKLDLALRLGYTAGPCGVSVPHAGKYIVRPIYNLSGMGLGAKTLDLEPDQPIQPGYFWCEYFSGNQYTIDYEWDKNLFVWLPVFAAEGIRRENLTEFLCWRKIDPPAIKLPNWFNQFSDVGVLNIEAIGDKIIEVHLRHGTDFPEGATEIIPIWSDMKYVENYEDADGLMVNPRKGFFYR